MKKITSKSIVLSSWKSATDRHELSPLLNAIGCALRSMPDRENCWDAANDMRHFSKRIADGDHNQHGGPYALRYQSNYVGEWTVKNKDLSIWSYVDMWVHRAEVDTMAPHIIAPITSALSLKRKQQAWHRYQRTGITKEHCSLLANCQWDMDMLRGDWISLFVEGKRPFGNSGAYNDIYEHAGWAMDWGDDGPSEKQKERAWNLFDELIFAVPNVAKQWMEKKANRKGERE